MALAYKNKDPKWYKLDASKIDVTKVEGKSLYWVNIPLSNSIVTEMKSASGFRFTDEKHFWDYSLNGSAKAINTVQDKRAQAKERNATFEQYRSDCDRLAGHAWDPKGKGKGVAWGDINASAAIEACTKATNTWPYDARMMYQLARAYNKANNKQAVYHLERAIKFEYPAACFHLGSLYDLGIFVTKDRTRAETLYQQAANRGSIPGLFESGQMDFKYGNKKRGEDTIFRAVQQDYPIAIAFIGIEISKGNVSNRTPSMATGFLRKAAKMGRSDASYRLAQMYKTGIGVSQNQSLYEEWMTFAAKQGNKKAKAAGF